MKTKIKQNTAKQIAAKYNMGAYIDYSSLDGWYYFENGKVGDGSNSRDEFFSYSDNVIHSLSKEPTEEQAETHKSWKTNWLEFLEWFYS